MKYRNVKTVIEGITFASKLEARYYQTLKLLEKHGHVSAIECHPKFPIVINGQKICRVELDFKYFDEVAKKTRYADTKGVYTAISRLKHKLLAATHGIIVEIVRS